MKTKVVKLTREFLTSEAGPTAVEYAIMLALIVGTIIGSVLALGGGSNGVWTTNAADIENTIQP